jgi:hypothetical protein
MNIPYTELDNVRTFSVGVLDDELIWHRDREDRIVTVMNGSNWKFQFDDRLPFDLRAGNTVEIPAMMYHRIIKTSETKEDLVIHIRRT